MDTRQDLTEVPEQNLIEQVLSSQNNRSNAEIASAAMTELTRRDFNFSKNLRELQNIHIPGANLAGAILTGVDFTGSDLSQVCLAQAQCMMTIFNQCQLQGIRFGQEAPLQAEGSVYAVAYHPLDNDIVAYVVEKEIHICRRSTGERLQTLAGHTYLVMSVAYRPDGGQLASGSCDNTVRLWDVPSGACEQTLTGHERYVTSVAYRPDGGQLASGSGDYTVRLWDVASGACEQTLTGHAESVLSVAYRPDGLQLASGSWDTTVRLWDVPSGACEQTLTGHEDWVTSVAYRPDGVQLASGSVDETVRLWDVASGDCEQTLTGHAESVLSVAYRPDGGQLASGSRDKTVRLWDVASGACEQTLAGHAESVLSVAYRPDGVQLASSSLDNTVRLWDPLSGACEQTLSGHDNVSCVEYRGDGVQLATGSRGMDKAVRLWDVASGSCEQTLYGHEGEVSCVAYRRDGQQLASASEDKTIRLWNVSSGECEQTLSGHQGKVECVVYRSDGLQLATGGGYPDSTVRLWDPVSGECTQTLCGHTVGVLSVAYRGDGAQLASCEGLQRSEEHTVRLWDSVSGASMQIITNHTNVVNSVAYSTDDRQLFSVGSNETIVWSVEGNSASPLMQLPGSCSVSIGGTQVVFGGSNSCFNQVIGVDMANIKRWIQTAAIGWRDLKLHQSRFEGAQGLTALDQRLLAYYQTQDIETLELIENAVIGEEKTEIVAEEVKMQADTVANKVEKNEDQDGASGESETGGQGHVEEWARSENRELEPAQVQYDEQAEQKDRREEVNDRPDGSYSDEQGNLLKGYPVVLEEKPLGVGGFGAVYKGRWRHQAVAVKKYTGDCLPTKLAREVTNEINVMLQLLHDCLIRFFGVIEHSDAPPMLVMEYCANGSLYNYLHSDQGINWTLRLRIAHEVIRGLAFLHDENIIHCDLKSLNVVLDGDLHAKLCDFGLSQLRLHSNTTSKGQNKGGIGGTLRWMAPELFSRRTAVPSRASDIWAYGMVLFELMARKLPYHVAIDEDQIKDFIRDPEDRGEDVPEACETHCPSIGPIMQRCWQERTERPSANELVEFIESVGVLVDADDEYDVADSESIAVRPAQATDSNATPSYNPYR